MDFTSALSAKADDIQRPANPPVGNYIWQVDKMPEFDNFDSSKTGKTYDRINITLNCVAPTDDVDEDEVAEYGNVIGMKQRLTFMMSRDPEDKPAQERTLFNIKRFLENCGLDLKKKTLEEALSECVGCSVMAQLRHRPDPNEPEIIYTEIGRTAPAE